ncbi:MAG TPA: DUF2637 domain-containing protein [Trebonia sp.]|nr:DUF2637 domain-containing protein [Trebonia sp.]
MERHPDTASSPGFPADPAPAQSAPGRNWLHRLVNFAVAIVVLAVAAGTFFLSYPGVHAIALLGGVSTQLARIYPGVFDAVLVIACVAAVMLRDGRWWARGWAWLVVIVVLAAIGTTDVLHAMNYGLDHRPTEGVVAAAPVVAVLLAFSLFLTMLRQSRPSVPDAPRRQAPAQAADDRAAEAPTAPMMFSAVDTVPVLAAGAVPRPPAPPIALPAGSAATVADGWPAAAPERAPDAPAVVTEARDQDPTEVMPVVVTEAREPNPTHVTPAVVTEAREPNPTQVTPAAVTEARDQDPTEVMPAVDAESSDADTDPGIAATREEPALTTTAEPQPEPSAPEVEASAEPGPDADAARPEAPAPVQQPIRYASSAAAEQFADEDWETEVDPALAGQVYPVLTSDPDIEVPPHQPGDSQDLEDDAPPFATAPFASVPRLNRVRVTPTPPTDDADAD